jgi:hypothetical protein
MYTNENLTETIPSSDEPQFFVSHEDYPEFTAEEQAARMKEIGL